MKKIYVAIALSLACYYTQAQTVETVKTGSNNKESSPSTPSPDENGVYNFAELPVKPEYPGGINKFRSDISDNFNFANLKAGDKGKQLKIHVSYLIEKDGTITDIKILKDPGYGAGKEVVRVLSMLKTKWVPGSIDNTPVRAYFVVPITLAVPQTAQTPPAPVSNQVKIVNLMPGDDHPAGVEAPSKSGDDQIHVGMTLEVKPEFPEGHIAFRKYITDGIKKENVTPGAEGLELKIFLSFVVEKDGSLSTIKIVKDPGFGLGNEVERVIKLITTKWKPGMQMGKPVRSSFTLPITYTVPK